jgi:hypothetical protein
MGKQITLVDAHVHVYPGADVHRLLTSAGINFASAARSLNAESWHANLLLTETAAVNWFDTIAAVGERTLGDWQLTFSSHDPVSLKAAGPLGTLRVIAGRQIVTAEKIEVHAFGTRAKFADGTDARATLQAVAQSGAMAALPWGVGKWLGARGKLVEDLLKTSHPRTLFAADNGGRPAIWPDRRLHVADQPVLRGSDPLPLPGEERRVGESGIWLDSMLPDTATAHDLLQRISSAKLGEVHSYGPTERLFGFVRNQLLLRTGRRTDRV